MHIKNLNRAVARGWLVGSLGLAFLLGAQGCAMLDQRTRQELEAAYGPNKPKIEETFAARWVTPGETWKIYINASDPDGDLKYFQVSMWVPGGIMTPVRLDLEPDQYKSISGYLTLHTGDFPLSILRFENSELTLYVALEDRAGHVSEQAIFPVSLVLGSKQEQPLAGKFKEEFLGNVPVQFMMISPTGGFSINWP